MKKLALALMATAAALFGTGLVANAYPPGAGVITSSPAAAAPGGIVTVEGSCEPGETVTVTLAPATATTVCGAAGTGPAGSQPSAGGYSVTIPAPDTSGTATGTASGSETGALGSFTVTVSITEPPVTQGGDTNGGGTLPSTGTDGTNTLMILGAGTLLVGAGLFVTARMRRNQDLATG